MFQWNLSDGSCTWQWGRSLAGRRACFQNDSRGRGQSRVLFWPLRWSRRLHWRRWSRWYAVCCFRSSRRWGSTCPWQWSCWDSACLHSWQHGWFDWVRATRCPASFMFYMCNNFIPHEDGICDFDWNRHFFLPLVGIVLLHVFNFWLLYYKVKPNHQNTHFNQNRHLESNYLGRPRLNGNLGIKS